MNEREFDHGDKTIAYVTSDHQLYTVGSLGVVAIKEHAARGEGDRWFYDVHYEDGKVIRIFQPLEACYSLDVIDDDIPF